jgi:hypothetical protein
MKRKAFRLWQRTLDNIGIDDPWTQMAITHFVLPLLLTFATIGIIIFTLFKVIY